jgi:carboxyl-terminal processing protease
MLKKKSIFILFLGIMLGVFVGTCGSVFADRDNGEVITDSETLPFEDLRTFTEIFGRIKRDYVEPVSDKNYWKMLLEVC